MRFECFSVLGFSVLGLTGIWGVGAGGGGAGGKGGEGGFRLRIQRFRGLRF